ncbi:MAG: DUF3102 domain-containing protein [Hydrococcus sp. CRU_1_1]|nr:DUF3102 domain-containing protein [Hydrococcus sp. CRU_1_1]
MTTSVPAPVSSSFDYTALDIDTASFVRQQTGEIHELVRRSAQDIFEIGQKLIQVKEKLGHGNFRNWLIAEFDWNERTAQNFMNVARQFKSETVAHLPLAATALYILSAPSTPAEIREEAIARAQGGEPITKKKATAMTRAHGQRQKKKASLEEEILDSSKVKTSPTNNESTTFHREPEIIDAELEEGRGSRAEGRRSSTSVSPSILNPDDTLEPNLLPPALDLEPSKALPPSPSAQWWRLSGKEQNHLLFCAHPNSAEFLSQLPEQVGIWMGFPPHPNQWLCPPPNRVNAAFSYSTIYQNIDLKAIREAVERVLETSDESDLSAIVAYLPDPPLVVLLEDFQITCYIAEPDVAQCQKSCQFGNNWVGQ